MIVIFYEIIAGISSILAAVASAIVIYHTVFRHKKERERLLQDMRKTIIYTYKIVKNPETINGPNTVPPAPLNICQKLSIDMVLYKMNRLKLMKSRSWYGRPLLHGEEIEDIESLMCAGKDRIIGIENLAREKKIKDSYKLLKNVLEDTFFKVLVKLSWLGLNQEDLNKSNTEN